MIHIGGRPITEDVMAQLAEGNVIKRLTLDKLHSSEKVYNYSSTGLLEFELSARAAIVHAAEKLNDSYFSFEVFKTSRCNPECWTRTEEGGFKIRPDVSPYRGIRDILQNSRLYGTECATAIVIVFYLGLTEVLPEPLFNELFAGVYLMDWKYLDKDLGVRAYKDIKDTLPGDCLYFDNPDVDPETPEWQGENVIQLINGKYYGHGIGIRTAQGFIRTLNQRRKRGATQSAYLTDTVVRPHYKYLYDRYTSTRRAMALRIPV